MHSNWWGEDGSGGVTQHRSENDVSPPLRNLWRDIEQNQTFVTSRHWSNVKIRRCKPISNEKNVTQGCFFEGKVNFVTPVLLKALTDG